MTFSDGTYFLGAPEFIMKDSYDAIAEEIASYVQKGYRLLLFAKQEADGILPLGYVTLSNPIRANAKETFSYFKEQDVAIRVISGDNPQTVSEVAKRAGIEGAENYVDATTLDSKAKIRDAVERYAVFGRVDAKAEAVDRQSLAGGRTYRCHDRRWCQRHPGNEGCGLQCGNGIRQRGVCAGGTGRPPRFGFCKNARGCI